MFIRKTKSRNSTCFQIGEKRYGKFVLAKHIGCSSSPSQIAALRMKAQQELAKILFEHQLFLFPQIKDNLKAKLLNWKITGFHQVFGKVYDQIGLPNTLLKDLVIARIVYPKSKLATMRYLNRYLGMNLGKNTLYRFLDQLNKDELVKIAFSFVSQRRKGISLIFYDVTTLYFETEQEDNFRKKGYSKDHRIDTPQILVGLFVDSDGYPFDFDIFEGNKFEGHTFQAAIVSLMRKYQFENLTVVADAGMLSESNLLFLESRNIHYIVGARLKNLPKELKDTIFMHDFKDEEFCEIPMDGKKLIVSFSKEREKKDWLNRERIIKKLEIRLAKNRQIIRRSKYLLVKGGEKVVGIDQKKIQEDKQFDGLKGYITNSKNNMDIKELISQYHNLWKIEKAFRMSKNDLRERPIFHFILKRITSHLLICFVSLLVMKETERILIQKGYSLEKVIEILGKIGQGKTRIGNVELEIDSELDQEEQSVFKLFQGTLK